ncbi:hypothetical protein SNEBB_006623, partial [Seison nebaliae]
MYGICNIISAYQLILFTPYWLNKFLENYECTPDVCKLISRVNSTRTGDMMNFDKSLRYSYLIHEMLIFSGCHKINEKDLDNNNEYPIGANTKRNVSLSLHNFMRMNLMDYKYPKNETSNRIRISLERNRTHKINQDDWKENELENGTNVEQIDEEELTRTMCMKYYLCYDLWNSMTFLLHHLFFQPNDILKEEIAWNIYKENGRAETVSKSKVFYPMSKHEHGEFIGYSPFFSSMYLGTRFKQTDDKYYHSKKILGAYLNNIHIRTFSERFKNEISWVREKVAEIITKHNFPKIVITEEFYETNMFYASEMNSKTYQNIDNRFSLIRNSREYRVKMLIGIYNHPLPPPEIRQYYPNIPEHFWDENELLPMRIFQNIVENDVSYIIYAMHLRNCDISYTLGKEKPQPFITNRKEDLINHRNNRVDQIIGRMNFSTLKEHRPEETLCIERYLRNFVKDIAWKETLATAGNYYVREKLFSGDKPGKPSPFIERIGKNSKPGHSIALVKSFTKPVWYLVDDHRVVTINNLKKFLIQRPLKRYRDFYISTLMWHETNSYGKELDKIKN